MLHRYWQCLLISTFVITMTKVAVVNAQTHDSIDIEKLENIQSPEIETIKPVEAVTSVHQLSDVQPTDWAFEALQSLIERYGCMKGYPDGKFEGNRALSRYEFAAALSGCVEVAKQIVDENRANFATQEELATLRRLQDEFAQELAKLPPRLATLEKRLEKVSERPDFSSHSQLLGKAIFGLSAVGGNKVDGNIIFSQRTELNIDTSFGKKDRLRIRLTGRNTPRFSRITDTDMSNLSFAGDNNNNVEINQISYRFRPIKKLQVFIAADGGSLTSFANPLNAPINSGDIGNISKFSDESAIYELGGNVGAGMEYRFSDAVRLSLGYMAGGRPNNPTQGIGGGAYGALAQLTLQPTEALSLGLTYVRAYNTIDTRKGSDFANEPFEDAATSANAYGVQTSWRLSKDLTVSGWLGFIDAKAESEPYKGSKASILTWAATLAINDIGGDGNMLGLVFGQPPKAISNDVAVRQDPDTALHFEAFYRYRLTDNLFITPGFFVIFNPEHNAGNDPIYVGTLRQTFLF
jgi:Carbohydrate-selective porin, OprB family/S-layer homology domain